MLTNKIIKTKQIQTLHSHVIDTMLLLNKSNNNN